MSPTNWVGVAMLAVPGVILLVWLLATAVRDVIRGGEDRVPALAVLAIVWLIAASFLSWIGR